MADDDARKKKLAQGLSVPPPPNYFVPPPPPPMAPSFANGPGAMPPQAMPPGMMQPQADNTPPAQQINLPGQFQAPQQSPSAVPQQYFQNLLQSAQDQQTMAKSLEDHYQNFQPAPLPEAPQQSPFEQHLDQAMQARMMKLLSGGESRGERFSKGWDVGQKIAANLIVPLMGMHGSAGNAIGTAQALGQLKQQAAEGERSRAAEASARNSTIMQMAQMWEGMSPQSSKNLLALASARLKADQTNRENQHQSLKDAIEARHTAVQGANNVLSSAMGMDKDSFEKAYKTYEAQTKGAELQSSVLDRGQRELNDQERLGLAKNADKRDEESLKLQQQGQKDSEAKFTYAQGRDKVTDATAENAQKLNAAKSLFTGLGQMDKDASAVNLMGQPKYGADFLDRITNNPGRMAVVDTFAKQAGIKVDAKTIFDAMKAKGALKAQASDNWMQNNSIVKGLKAMAGGDKEALPDKQSVPATPTDAIERFYAKNGRKPTVEELKAELNGASK